MLSKEELLKIKGGGINISLAASIGAIITFIAGIIDGYVNPIKCSNAVK